MNKTQNIGVRAGWSSFGRTTFSVIY